MGLLDQNGDPAVAAQDIQDQDAICAFGDFEQVFFGMDGLAVGSEHDVTGAKAAQRGGAAPCDRFDQDCVRFGRNSCRAFQFAELSSVDDGGEISMFEQILAVR